MASAAGYLGPQAAEESAGVPDVLMLRHCESAGWAPDASLTRRGYEQAAALVDALRDMPVDYIVSSPFLRAYETVASFAHARGLEIDTDARLAERKRSDAPLENWQEWVRRSFSDLDYHAPGGESGREVALRGSMALAERLDSGHTLPLLSTHGQLLSFLANSVDPDFGYEKWGTLGYPALLRFICNDGVVTFETLSVV